MANLLGNHTAGHNLAAVAGAIRTRQAQQAPVVRCSAVNDQAAKSSGLQNSLLAAAASVAIALAPQPAVASGLASLAPREVLQIAQAKSLLPDDKSFQPEKSVPGSSTAQEAAAQANPTPFDPAVIGGSAGLLLLAFAFSTGRADPQLKRNSGKASSGGGGAESSRVAAVKDRKQQARSWIGDWQKRTKKST